MRRGKNNSSPNPGQPKSNPTPTIPTGQGSLTAKQTTQLSKKLSYLLRHGAVKDGFNLDSAGFILVDEILAHQNYNTHTIE